MSKSFYQTSFVRALLPLAFLLISSRANADGTSDFYIQQSVARFFNLPQDAKTLSLGGSTLSLASGSFSLFGNPAGLGFLERAEVSGTIGYDRERGRELFSEDSFAHKDPNGHILYALPLSDDPELGAIALGYSRYNGKANDSIHTRNDGHTRNIAYGLPLSSEFSLGYALSFFDDQLTSDLADYHAHARFRHSLGIQYQITPKIKVGEMLFYGLGQSDSEEFAIESNGLTHQKQWSNDLGISYTFDSGRVVSTSFSVDKYSAQGDLDVQSPLVVVGDDEDGIAYGFHLGADEPLLDNLNLRGGYRFQQIQGYHYKRSDIQSLSGGVEFNAFSLGLGYRFDCDKDSFFSDLRVDYGAEYRFVGSGEVAHVLTFSLPVG